MSDISILNLVELAAGSLQTDDVLCIVDVHDPTQSPGGSTKKILLSSLYANPTFTGTIHGATLNLSTSLVMASAAPVMWTNSSQQIVGNVGASTITYTATTHAFVGSTTCTGSVSAAAQVISPDLASNSGGVDLTFHNGATLVGTLSGTTGMATFPLQGRFTATVFVNRVSAASLLGYYGVTRNGTALYYLGQDASDNGVILNAAASTSNLTWTDSGNFTVRGALTTGSTLTSGASVVAAASSSFVWSGRSQMISSADGNVQLLNNAATGFNNLIFGGTSSSFPMLQRSTTGLLVRLGDDSAYTFLRAASLLADSFNASGFVGTAKILGGTTGVSIRNNADSADNLLITDAGALTGRSSITATGDLSAGAHVLAAGGRVDMRNNGTISVSTSATTILATAATNGSLALVNGTDGSNSFMDLVIFGGNAAAQGGFGGIQIAGSAAVRTYTCVSGNLKLAMGSGTYSISVSELRPGTSGT